MQVTQQPSLVHSHLQLPWAKLHWHTHTPLQVTQQPHMPPQQPPPEGRGADEGAGAGDAPPTEANIDSRRREPTWPCGHSMGSEASAMERRASKVSSQMGQRYS